jgi:putative transposase
MRKTVFANNEYYHIYNRGVDKREVFLDEEDSLRFLRNLREFNNKLIREARDARSKFSELSSGAPELSSENLEPLVEIIVYCLNPNHYHLILKQNSEKGIERFMHKLSTGYTNYFNKKNKRSGALFQGRFKAIHIDSNEYLLLLSAYINKNYFIHGYEISPSDWPYCSALDYLGKKNGTLCKKEIILDQFAVAKSELNSENYENYAQFLDVNANYFKDKKDLEKYILE